jgi:hypothetical protein
MSRYKRKFSERETPEYREWRLAVFERDQYKCLLCGSKQEIHAHHIDRWADNVAKRVTISNGATVCKICHNKYHKGWKCVFPYEITSILLRKTHGNYAKHYLQKAEEITRFYEFVDVYEDYWEWDKRNDKTLENIDVLLALETNGRRGAIKW